MTTASDVVPEGGSVRRRDLLVAAAVALVAHPARAAAQGGEAAILARLIAREEAAAEAHGIAATGFDHNEADHARALRTLLAAFDRRAPATTELDPAARRLAGAAPDDVPGAAADLETELLDDYAAALAAISEESILRTVATIMASHAQHRALLLRDLGRDPLR